jgi:hypothetical protein
MKPPGRVGHEVKAIGEQEVELAEMAQLRDRVAKRPSYQATPHPSA